MKFNFKKIVPIAIGAVLLGSTIGFAGALAADVSYPNDFADAVVVIGAAGAADTVAANMIANDLGRLTTGVATAVSDGWLVKKGSSELNYGEDFADIKSEIGNAELSSLLSDTDYRDNAGENKDTYETEETLTFSANGDSITFASPTKGDNKDNAGTYLALTEATDAYTYKLEFTTAVEYDNSKATTLTDDFEMSKLTMLGSTWTITDVDASSLAVGPNKITLLGGATEATLKSGEKTDIAFGGKTYSVEATVFGTSSSDKSAQLVINGETITLDEKETDELSDGTKVGVTQIETSAKETTADVVTFYMGAKELILENGTTVNLDGEDLDNTEVLIGVTGADKELNSITISASPEDNTWVGIGQSWTEPVFGAFKLVFAGLEQTTETVKFTPSGGLEFKNNAGKDITLELTENGTNVFLGDDSISNTQITSLGRILSQGNLIATNNDKCQATVGDLEDCVGLLMLVVDGSGEARIIELSDVDLTDDKIKFKDLTNGGETTEDIAWNSSSATYDVGFTDISATIARNGSVNNGSITVTAINGSRIETSLEAVLMIADSSGNIQVTVYNDTTATSGDSFNITYDTGSDDAIETANVGRASLDETKDSDWKVGLDSANYGIIWRSNDEDDNEVTITIPDDPTVANVYVAPVSAIVSGGGIVPVISASNLGDYKTTKDLVVVGGSAINAVAADLLKVAYPTYGIDAAWTTATGVSENMALIKLFSGADKTFGTGKVALLVAGYEAKDTQAAAKALIAEKKFGLLSTTTASAYSYK